MSVGKVKRQHGLWNSSITPSSLASGIKFTDVVWDQGGSLVWLEVRSGRGVLVVQPPDGQAPRDLNSDFSVRARLGYGGGDFTVGHGQVYFIEAGSGRLFRQPVDHGTARPVTPAYGFSAAPALSPDGNWLLFCHSYEGLDSLGIVDARGEFWPRRLAAGEGFYMQPVWSPDGQYIAWVDWNQPNMPWDGTFLRLGKLCFQQDCLPSLEEIVTIAGDRVTSIFQPEFSPDGRYLAYISDASGWWQIYLYDLAEKTERQITNIAAEHGNPAWTQGMRTYAFSPDSGTLFALRNHEGYTSLWQISLLSGEEQRLTVDEEYSHFSQLHSSSRGLALIASGDRLPPRIITYRNLGVQAPEGARREVVHICRRSTSEELAGSAYARSQAIQWQSLDGEIVFGLFYRPTHPVFDGIGKIPLALLIHSGPTSQALAEFDPRTQFFTSRGYAVLRVNYRGSTGYGREYRDKLRGNWGVYDVQDAVSGAQHLIAQGQVDQERLVIIGSSAGGFTVLKALVDYPRFFKAGICMYGISDHFAMLDDMHKFEAYYSEALLGPLPEAAAVYRERSPLNHIDKIQDAVALFQGEDDKVVPRKQSDDIAAALQRRGVPHVYHLYPGEGHGFRQAKTIEHMYNSIDKFLRRHVIFS